MEKYNIGFLSIFPDIRCLFAPCFSKCHENFEVLNYSYNVEDRDRHTNPFFYASQVFDSMEKGLYGESTAENTIV